GAPGIAGTGRSQSLEAQILQQARTARIPRIGKHKTDLAVQGAELGALGYDILHGATMTRSAGLCNCRPAMLRPISSACGQAPDIRAPPPSHRPASHFPEDAGKSAPARI